MAAIRTPLYFAYVGEGIPDLALWLIVDGQLLTGTAYQYSMTVHDPDDLNDLFTKSAGFTGQIGTGDGSSHSDIPNVIVSWDASAETSLLTEGRTHKATLIYTRTADNKIGYFSFVIRGVDHQ